MKKYLKFSLLTIIGLFAFQCSVNAQQLNLQELGAEIKKVDEYANYAYIVGEHIFVGDITLTDVMVASRTIDVEENEEIYKQMNIYKVRYVNGQWVVGQNLIGSGNLKNVMDNGNKKKEFNYINGKFVESDTTYTISNDFSKFEKDLEKYNKPLYFKINSDLNVTGLVQINESKKFGDLDTTYYYPYVLHIDDANDKTEVTFQDTRSQIVKKNGEDYLIYVSLERKNYADNNVEQAIAVVDKDGDGDHYRSATYTLNFIGSFQQVSANNLNVSLNNELISGYVKNVNETVALTGSNNNLTLAGNLYEQDNINGQNGYYAALKLTRKNGESFENSVITSTAQNVTINKANTETIVTVKLTEDELKTCKSQNNCHLDIKVDLDGESKKESGNEYLESTYTIDYSGLQAKDVTIVQNKELVKNSLTGEEVLNTNEEKTVISGYLANKKNGKYEISYNLVTNKAPVENSTGVVKVLNAQGTVVTTYDANQFANNTITVTYAIPEVKDNYFKIKVDLDGEEGTKYDPYEFTVNYKYLYAGDSSSTEYYKYLIYKTVNNTQSANNLTFEKQGNIKASEHYTVEYDKDKYLMLYKSKDNSIQEYIFGLKNIDNTYMGSTTSLSFEKTSDSTGNLIKNGWKYKANFSSVGMGIIELELLKDSTIDAIDSISKSTDHKFEVTINKARFDEWLKAQYGIDNKETTPINLTVELDDTNTYVKNIVKTGGTYTFDVQISNVNATTIQAPTQVFNATKEDLLKFYEEIKKWVKENTNHEIY